MSNTNERTRKIEKTSRNPKKKKPTIVRQSHLWPLLWNYHQLVCLTQRISLPAPLRFIDPVAQLIKRQLTTIPEGHDKNDKSSLKKLLLYKKNTFSFEFFHDHSSCWLVAWALHNSLFISQNLQSALHQYPSQHNKKRTKANIPPKNTPNIKNTHIFSLSRLPVLSNFSLINLIFSFVGPEANSHTRKDCTISSTKYCRSRQGKRKKRRKNTRLNKDQLDYMVKRSMNRKKKKDEKNNNIGPLDP